MPMLKMSPMSPSNDFYQLIAAFVTLFTSRKRSRKKCREPIDIGMSIGSRHFFYFSFSTFLLVFCSDQSQPLKRAPGIKEESKQCADSCHGAEKG